MNNKIMIYNDFQFGKSTFSKVVGKPWKEGLVGIEVDKLNIEVHLLKFI